MIKVIYGKKGAGKTRVLIDTANSLIEKSAGLIVYLDDNNQPMFDLKHEIRFINMAEYPIINAEEFMGFICGLVSGNYDIEGIFIDGLTYIVKQNVEELKSFFDHLRIITDKFNVNFYVSINGDPDSMPDYLRFYLE